MQTEAALDADDDNLDALDGFKRASTFIVRHTAWSLLLTIFVFAPAGVHVYEVFDSMRLNIDLNSFRVESDASADNFDTLQAIKPFSFAAAQTQKSFGTLTDGPEQLEQPIRIVFLGINEDEDLLDQNNLELVRSIENKIRQNPLWRRYCRQRADGECEAFDSVTKVLYASSQDSEMVFDGQGETMIDRDKALHILIQQSAYAYFDRQFSPSNVRSRRLVAFTQLVIPEPSTASDDASNIIDSALSDLRPFFSSLGGGDRIEVLYEGDEVRAAVGHDMRLVIPSFAFLFIFISLSLGSPFVAVAGCLSIVLSFVPAVSVYLLLFSTDFSTLTTASIWIIFGIGTDDIFVFTMMWKQSEHKTSCSAGDLARRLSWTMRHAGKTMFISSFTTAVAFFAMMATRIKALSEFGVFMGALVVFNYIFTMSLFPCCIILYETHVRRLRFCPAWSRRSASYRTDNVTLNYSYAKLLTRHRWLLLIVFLSLTAVMACHLARMRPATKLTKILKSNRNIESHRWLSENLLQTQTGVSTSTNATSVCSGNDVDNALDVSLVFGVGGIDRHRLQPIWDKRFDMAADAEILSGVCQRVLELDIRGDDLLRGCLFDELKEFAEVWPLPRDNFTQTMTSFLNGVGEAYQDQVGLDDGAAFWRLDIVTRTHKKATAASLEHEFDEWQTIAHDIDEMVSTRVFQTSSVWPRMRLEKELIKGSLLSCAVTIAISALSLLFFSRSFIIAFMGVVTTTFVLVCVCGVLQLLDWSFGVVEALSLSMLVGYFVVYQMHIGHVYATSDGLGRIERVKAVICNIGAPILASSLTTAGGAAFLLFGSVSIFVTFGVIVVLTATFSLLFTMVFLNAALAVFGPVQRNGGR